MSTRQELIAKVRAEGLLEVFSSDNFKLYEIEDLDSPTRLDLDLMKEASRLLKEFWQNFEKGEL